MLTQGGDRFAVEYTPQTHNASDFDVFFGNYSKDQVGERPTLVSIDGGFLDPEGDPGESSLDLQYVLGLVGKKQNFLWGMVRAFRASECLACFPFSDCFLGWSYLLLFALVLSQVRVLYYHAQKKS